MKQTMIALMALMAFAGCAKMDAPYSDAKETYLAAKPIVKVIPKDETTKAELTIMDAFATMYDELRTMVRGEQDEKKGDADTTSTLTTSVLK